MRAGASNIAITPITAPSRTLPNMKARANSARRCPSCAAASNGDLKRRKLGRDTVLAAVVRLLDQEHHPRRQRGICPRQRQLRRDHIARPPCPQQGRQDEDALHRQARHRPRSDDHRRQPEAHRQAVPGSPRPDAVPIYQRRRRAAGDRSRPTSTPTSARPPAAISPPSISAPGAPASSPSINCCQGRATTGSASRRSSSRSPKRSATPPR